MIVVLGTRAEFLLSALDFLVFEIAFNKRWAEGMGASIQAGLGALEKHDVSSARLMLSDQPFVYPEFLTGLAEPFRCCWRSSRATDAKA